MEVDKKAQIINKLGDFLLHTYLKVEHLNLYDDPIKVMAMFDSFSCRGLISLKSCVGDTHINHKFKHHPDIKETISYLYFKDTRFYKGRGKYFDIEAVNFKHNDWDSTFPHSLEVLIYMTFKMSPTQLVKRHGQVKIT